ncbi:MAG TPA: ATP-binding protein [Bryobacteraceae bacterium]|jgi:two-component system sensor histidine kinase KdpD|nr:ATP-binding protein [Bryobacteraceae bacterium]
MKSVVTAPGSRFALNRLGDSAKCALPGGVAVALTTGLCDRLHSGFTVASFLFLLIVLFQSIAGDFLSSIAVSLAAVGCLDYFFVDPLYSFEIARRLDAIALLAFLSTALVVTRLVLRVEAKAESAARQREELDQLYRLSQRLLALKPLPVVDTEFLEPFHGVFGSTAVSMFDADTAELHSIGHSQSGLVEKTREAYVSGRDTDDPALGITVRRLRVSGRVTGAIGFEGLERPEATSGPLAALAAMLLERARALRDASRAAAEVQTEVYRSAVLDALAHEFKTPLATILAAAGGIREAGPLMPMQSQMAEMVEAEAARLGGLTSRLLRIARLDREEVKPRMEPVDVGSVVTQLVQLYARRSPDRRICYTPIGALEVLADPELLRLALSQLLENACKYSQPGSAVTVDLEKHTADLAIRVSNNGSSISPADQRRIFERFYRGMEASHLAAGSGLGLYVARKIAAAHGGRLDLESEVGAGNEVTFRLTLPDLKAETEHVVTNH